MNLNKKKEVRSLSEIAIEIREDWSNVNYAAKPYLSAMLTLDGISDKFMLDSGRSVVLYFLSNASSWRGQKAREIKLELKKMIT